MVVPSLLECFLGPGRGKYMGSTSMDPEFEAAPV